MDWFTISINGELPSAVEDTLTCVNLNGLREAKSVLPLPRIYAALFHVVLLVQDDSLPAAFTVDEAALCHRYALHDLEVALVTFPIEAVQKLAVS
jgi:hypothetical protein